MKVCDRKTARRAAERLLDLGLLGTVIAAGKGNLAVHPGADECREELWLRRLPVKAIDATGAGDAFAAAMAVALAERKSFFDAATFANAAAGLATTKVGAQPALPTRSAVLGLLRRVKATNR